MYDCGTSPSNNESDIDEFEKSVSFYHNQTFECYIGNNDQAFLDRFAASFDVAVFVVGLLFCIAVLICVGTPNNVATRIRNFLFIDTSSTQLRQFSFSANSSYRSLPESNSTTELHGDDQRSNGVHFPTSAPNASQHCQANQSSIQPSSGVQSPDRISSLTTRYHLPMNVGQINVGVPEDDAISMDLSRPD